MRRFDVEISVLGPLAVRTDAGEIELGPQLRRMLAILVARHDSVLSVDRLVDGVWQGEPPDGAERSLRVYATRLRKAIDPARDGVIEFQSPGYVLTLDGRELDSDVFEAELDESIALLRSGDEESAIRVLTSALGRWRGDAYAGFADEDWARPEALRLEERRIEAAELLVEARLGLGDAEQAVAEARALAAAQPLRERPRELLMRALYASGRQAEALREFGAFRSLLVDEAGLDPTGELVDLEGRIARSDPGLSGAVRSLRGYDLGERIGEGAFSVVRRAVQPGIGRDVAVKIIRSELADRPEFVRRFEREAQLVASVEHPHVVPLYDYWREPGAAYLVMRLMRGGSVEDVLRARGPFSQPDAARVLRHVGGALEAAHRRGVVHRDVRPANVLLDEDGAAYLADFGIALPSATTDGLAIVSPAHASPEVLRGEPASAATDVLSLGVTAFELLTGRLPFADSTDRAQLIRRQLTDPLPSARATRADLPARLDEVLARATAKAADDRHASVGALVAELVELLDPPAGARRSTPARPDSRPSHETAANPYVGLHAFEEADADRFHGREALVTELVGTLTEQRLVVVVGPSGSGKSSVVRAGLVPALRQEAIAGSNDWFIVGMVPGPNPIDALEAALLRVAVNPPTSLREQLAQPGGLLRAVQRVLPDDSTTLLVVIDQFEELFTMTGGAEQDRFLDELATAIAAPRSPLRVVATLRADHYDRPLRHRMFAELTTTGTVTVRPMTPSELERVIVQPAARVGVDVEPALLAELIAGVVEQPAALPLLQFALTEVFERRVSDLMLASVHHDLGGLTGAVAARADRIVDDGDQHDEAETRRIFGRLVATGDGTEATRRRAVRSEFGDDDRTARLLDAFVSARLLTSGHDEATREPTVEVAHEALLRDWPRLREWLDEDRDDLRTMRTVRSAAEGWLAASRDSGELARGGRLDTVTELYERRPELFNAGEAEWISTSLAAARDVAEAEAAAAARDRRQNRRLRQLLAAAGVLVVLALVATAVALVLRNRAITSERRAVAAQESATASEDEAVAARQQAETALAQSDATRREAEVAALAGNARLLAASEPITAMLLALEASARSSTDEPTVAAALLESLSADPRVRSLHPPVPSTGLVIQPRSGPYYTYVTSGSEGGATIDVVNVEQGTTRTLELDYLPGAATTDPAGRFLFSVGGDRLLLYDTSTGALVADQPVANFFVSEAGPDGDDIAAAYPDGRLVVHTLPDFEVVSSVEVNPDTFELARSGDGLIAALLDQAGSLVITPVDGSADRLEFPVPANTGTVALDSTGAEVAVSSRTGPTYVVDLTDPTSPVEISAGASTDLAFGPDDRLLAIGTADGIEIYDTATGEPAADPLVFATGVTFHFTGARTLRAFAPDLGVVEIDLDAPSRIVREVDVPDWGMAAFLAPDLSTAVTFAIDDAGTVIERLVVDPTDSATVAVNSIGPATSTRSSRPIIDGRYMTADTGTLRYEESDADGLIQTIDLSGAVTRDFEFFIAPRVGTSRDILILAEAGEALLGSEIVVVDRVRGEVALQIADRGVTVAEFAGADESEIVVGDLDGRVRWFGLDGSAGADDVTVGAAVGAVAVSDDGSWTAVGDWSGTVTLLDAEREPVAELANDAPFPIRMAFVGDGARLVVQSEDGSIVLWDVEAATRIGTLYRTDGLRGAFEVVPDGSSIVVATGRGISVISVDPEQWRRTACESVNRRLSAVELRLIVADIEPIGDTCGPSR